MQSVQLKRKFARASSSHIGPATPLLTIQKLAGKIVFYIDTNRRQWRGGYSPRGWEDWKEDEENLWNDPSWKVFDCPTPETNLPPPGVDEVVVAERGDSDQASSEHPEQLDGILKVAPLTDQISPLPPPYLSLGDKSVGLSPHSSQTSSPDPSSTCDQKVSASPSARMIDEWQSPLNPAFPNNRADSMPKNEGKKRKLQDDNHDNENGQKRQKQV
ncbi:hypothetical protein CORC01_14358 [Colletotrichum orchidophilum]|uniref:Uncharacterized protein n=1 Tax=Colletotrichum orchidophilum TaxID=1209926 RepID=A0A1G4AMN9_9PEZI|nr:uncharacterized protein CORC01_14358 [Colletotrichum orchidophilum]OHE90345.1 hypothetical protein CORC01_14358 [Colletotrichum orchidophilum]